MNQRSQLRDWSKRELLKVIRDCQCWGGSRFSARFAVARQGSGRGTQRRLWIEQQRRGDIVRERDRAQLRIVCQLLMQAIPHQLALGGGEAQSDQLLGRRDQLEGDLHSSPA